MRKSSWHIRECLAPMIGVCLDTYRILRIASENNYLLRSLFSGGGAKSRRLAECAQRQERFEQDAFKALTEGPAQIV